MGVSSQFLLPGTAGLSSRQTQGTVGSLQLGVDDLFKFSRWYFLLFSFLPKYILIVTQVWDSQPLMCTARVVISREAFEPASNGLHDVR